jgi:glycolate oxidase FAD binding subunit
VTAGSSIPISPEIVSPSTPDEVAAALRAASDARRSVQIRGGGSKLDWARNSQPPEIVLNMRSLNRVLTHAHGDLTATVEAGVRLSDLNAALGAHGQCLPLDPPFADRATIGGLLATNDSWPLRHRYGTPRDLVIGVQIATTDGTLARAGGQVVKNVAGYDLSKLITGSFGSLAAIVSATFKLTPVPVASRTLVLNFRDSASQSRAAASVAASQLEPVAFEIQAQTPGGAGFMAMLRFASLPVVVDAQLDRARVLLATEATSTTVLEAAAEVEAWDRHGEHIWTAAGAIVRASWLPANLAVAIEELERISGAASVKFEIIGRAAVGAGLIRIDADVATQSQFIERLRASSAFGNVVIRRGSDELKSRIDVWGPHGDRLPLLAALKQAFDPHGILSQGRGPL